MIDFESTLDVVKRTNQKINTLWYLIACCLITTALLFYYNAFALLIPTTTLLCAFGIQISTYKNQAKFNCTYFLNQRLLEIKHSGKDRQASTALIDVLGIGATMCEPSADFLVDCTKHGYLDTRSVDIFKRYVEHKDQLEREFPTNLA
tara:strand:- start:8423 stop:8866 length:444 start_codon:yes stop_codon:yes gene_type:complete